MTGGLRTMHVDLVGAVALVALTAVGGMTLVQPLLSEQGAVDSMEARLAEQQTQADSLQRTATALERQLELARQRLDVESVELHPLDQLNRRVAELTDLVAGTGMLLHETSTGEPVPAGFYQRVPMTLSGTGSYGQCAAFLHALHQRMPDTAVVAMELSGNPRRPDETPSFRFDLVWYSASAGATPAVP